MRSSTGIWKNKMICMRGCVHSATKVNMVSKELAVKVKRISSGDYLVELLCGRDSQPIQKHSSSVPLSAEAEEDVLEAMAAGFVSLVAWAKSGEDKWLGANSPPSIKALHHDNGSTRQHRA
ncbi:hypothetical protein TRVL_03659 [Trypanosoma vivax]|nr:hypothetical protein TRVL_03659 [Trypanosoma vivax]